jgi:chemotaxis protein methyltransferase CheR
VSEGGWYAIREIFKGDVEFVLQDIRLQVPEGSFHLVLCRNLCFTYFDEDLQKETLGRIMEKLVPGGILVVGRRESLPHGAAGITQVDDTPGIFQKETKGEAG